MPRRAYRLYLRRCVVLSTQIRSIMQALTTCRGTPDYIAGGGIHPSPWRGGNLSSRSGPRFALNRCDLRCSPGEKVQHHHLAYHIDRVLSLPRGHRDISVQSHPHRIKSRRDWGNTSKHASSSALGGPLRLPSHHAAQADKR